MVKIKAMSFILLACLLLHMAECRGLSVGEFYGSTEIQLDDIYGVGYYF